MNELFMESAPSSARTGIKRNMAAVVQNTKVDGGATASPRKHYASGTPDNDNPSKKKKRKLGSTDDGDNDDVIDLTSPAMNDVKQRPKQNHIFQQQHNQPRMVISLVDSSSDEDEDGNPAARQTLDRDDNTTNSTKKTTTTAGILEEYHHDGEYDGCADGRTIVEIIDDETDSLPSAAYPLHGVAPRAAAASRSNAPFADNTTRTGSLFLDYVEGDLSHDRKEEIYADARRPAQRLQEELEHLYAQLRTIDANNHHLRYNNDRNRDEWNVCNQQIDRVKEELKTAGRNAAQDIYNRNNSAGGMGNMDARNGRLSVDFHGLYVKEAITKFIEIVMPILPVQREVVIITGKGNHSKNGKSKLRDGLVAHIKHSDEFKRKQIRYAINPSNTGELIVKSQKSSRLIDR
jgi:hypothetical protein